MQHACFQWFCPSSLRTSRNTRSSTMKSSGRCGPFPSHVEDGHLACLVPITSNHHHEPTCGPRCQKGFEGSHGQVVDKPALVSRFESPRCYDCVMHCKHVISCPIHNHVEMLYPSSPLQLLLTGLTGAYHTQLERTSAQLGMNAGTQKLTGQYRAGGPQGWLWSCL